MEQIPITWRKVKEDGLPTNKNYQVITYTPGIKNPMYSGDEPVFRLVTAQFAKTMSDITHWAYVYKPEEN